MLRYYWRRALACYHCARPAGYLVQQLEDSSRWRYEGGRGETRPARSTSGRLVCGHCQGPLYQGEAERIFPLEPVEPEAPRKRGRPRKHPLPTAMPLTKAS
jgi:hypothetical protein